ncbi:hypothetical protein AKJ09_01364 [Labilithrix luteola]|uniref:PEGA domain-containing protein n=1 Tax=Labilithrix luteola TaxID=1391654 RepID=A0A0K1PME2_9BACT|nr:hypothetical protein [Labilithrix luteola]AKU94700.1 hypothetical protein AKJ09_01364 [Labilithrix luteola]
MARLGPLVFALATAVASLSTAASARAENEAPAEALFIEAKRLVAAGDYAAACPKFAESNRLDRAAGTMIHLADCYEKNHQLATAWATYREAASAAKNLGRLDWQRLALARAEALDTKVGRLTIEVTEPADKIEVRRDGVLVSSASWGTPLPLDAGRHTIEATAAGRQPFTTTVTTTDDGVVSRVTIPKLAVAPAEADTREVPAEKASIASSQASQSNQKTWGYVVGGVGLVGLAVGTVAGLVAIEKNADATRVCPNDGVCPSEAAIHDSDTAKTFGTISTIALVAGGAAVVTGLVLVLTSPSSPKHEAKLAPSIGPNTAALSLSGVF